jgi:UDP-N-acetylmuramyl tripeptide synthase
MSHKIAKLAFWLIPILCLSLCPIALAQGTAPEKQEKKADKSAHTQSVTGCLQKGDEPGEFSITGEDGKTWGLRSTSVKLDEHLGHKVNVTGTTTHETKAEEKKEGQVENAASKAEYADLTVTSLKMVSETCSK